MKDLIRAAVALNLKGKSKPKPGERAVSGPTSFIANLKQPGKIENSRNSNRRREVSPCFDVFRLSCAARIASASDLHETPIRFRYASSVACWYSAF